MHNASTELSASLRRALGWSCLASVLVYSVADQSLEFLTFIGVGTLIAWRVAVRPGRPAPRHAINAGLLGVVGLGVLQTFRFGLTVTAFAYFIGLLLVVKLFDLRRAADWGQALVLISGMIVAAVLTNNSMPTGVLLAVNAVLLFRAILRYHLLAASERAFLNGPITIPPPLRRDLRSILVGVGFAILLGGTTIFLILPRDLGSQAFGQWGSSPPGQTTGFADELSLGQPGLISQSSTPVMDITLLDSSQRNIGRLDAPPLYLRGAVLTDYEPGRWYRAKPPGSRTLLRPQFVPPGGIIRPRTTRDAAPWEVELRVTVRDATARHSTLFTLWEAVELQTTGDGQMLAIDPFTGVITRDGSGGMFEYTARCADPRRRPIRYPDQWERGPLDDDPIPPSIGAYAAGVLTDAEIEPSPARRALRDDFRAVRVLENHLQSQFRYTLEDLPAPPGRDPTEWFLTTRKEGHCEYFASALALLCRSVGVRARVVTGYIASDYNDVSGRYVVRESGAHAWTEAEVSPGVWLTFDATPRSEFNQVHRHTPGLWRSITKVYETIEHAWIVGVVAYDSGARSRILGDVGGNAGLQNAATRVFHRLRDGGARLFAKAMGVGVLVFCASMLLGLTARHGGVVLARLWGRAHRPRRLGIFRRARQRPDEALRVQMLRVLEAHHAAKPPHEPMRSHLDRAVSGLPAPVGLALSRACDRLYEARFAPLSCGTDALVGALRDLRASENARRAPSDESGVKARSPGSR